MLQKALHRASAIAPVRHICTVVATQHRVWRDAQLQHLLADNVIEQPQDRGTAHGVLLPLVHILARDPDASIVLLPADHYVHDEAVFANALRRAAECAAGDRKGVYLLGIEPNEPDADFGYIVPEHGNRQPSPVIEFIEQPPLDRARSLVARGALWNTFIVASSACALLDLYSQRFVSTIVRMRHAVDRHQDPTFRTSILADLYRELTSRDFSREILEGHESLLQVIRVPPCGWTDLGTPQRVAQALQRLPRSVGATGLISNAALGLDLAAQHWRLEFSRNQVAG